MPHCQGKHRISSRGQEDPKTHPSTPEWAQVPLPPPGGHRALSLLTTVAADSPPFARRAQGLYLFDKALWSPFPLPGGLGADEAGVIVMVALNLF